MTKKVTQSPEKQGRRIEETAKPMIAVNAEKSTDYACLMVMVNMKIGHDSTDSALSILPCTHRLKFRERQTIEMLQIRVFLNAFSLLGIPFRPFGRTLTIII